MKNQIKKGLSLIMVVLMVLSCWVWIAPTEAEAAEPAAYFPVTITYSLSNNSGAEISDVSYIKVHYYELNDNGTINTNSSHTETISLDHASFTSYTKTYNMPGFPYMIEGNIDTENILAWAYVRINNLTMKVGNQTVVSNQSWQSKGAADPVYYSWSYANDTTSTWRNPNFQATGFSSTAKTLNVPTYGSTDTVATDAIGFAYKDTHYNVTWNRPFEIGLGTTADDVKFGANMENSFWYDSADKKVKATAEVQAVLPMPITSNSATRTFYLIATDGIGQTHAQPINLVYPSYKVEWLADQSVLSDPATAVELKNNTTCGASAAKFSTNYYGWDITKKYDNYPTGVATKQGYTFYGFWSEPQPGNSTTTDGAYAFEADFKQPISTNEYNALSEEQKELYYPAGIKYDVKDPTSTTITGSTKWYGWWVSNDIIVKFYDVNGKFLQETAVKYGYNNTQIQWPTPTEQYTSGSYQYSNFTGTWEGANGEEVNKNGYTFTHDLILTPKYETVSFTKTYTVNFVNSFGVFGPPHSATYTYREQANVPAASDVAALQEGNDYRYEFIGWASSTATGAPIGAKNYHIVLEDGDFDVDGNAVYLVNDFTVRENVTYYPVFRRFLKSHDVTFIFRNDKGEEVTKKLTFEYGQTLSAPDGVPMEYATGGFGYTFLGWTKDNADVTLSEQTCTPGLTFRAKYSDGVATPYTLTFVYKNEKGEEVSDSIQVNHGSKVSSKQENADLVEGLYDKAAKTYDDGTNLNTFYGAWEYDDVGRTMNAAEILNYSPESHMTFRALYTNPQPFYTATYVDGNETKEFRIVTGTELPYWTVKTTEGEGEDAVEKEETYLPVRSDTDAGFYTFTGWFDAEEGGTQYIPGTTPITSNVTLYPQFSFGEFEYHYVFLNYDGSELARGTFHYNDKLDDLIAEAEKLAVRAADETYTYQFLGWDKRVPSFCEGGEPDSTLVFTAQYKPEYIMYHAYWYNSLEDLEAGNAELAKQSYVYGEKVRTPSVVTTPNITAPAGQNAVFAGWFYKDADGVAQPYTKQLTNSGYMKFYATYKLTPKAHTVTVIVSENESYTITVADGETIKENMIVQPASGYVDATKHKAFDKWTIGALATGAVFEIGTTAVTSDITLYANFTESAHDLTNKEVMVLPTYPANAYTDFDGTEVAASTGVGTMEKWCSCNKEQTKQTEEIPALTDTVVPGATIYLGTQWNSDDGFADKTETKAYLGKNSPIIITTSDSGDVNALYNASGKGSGVESITVIVGEGGTLEQAQRALSVGGGTRIYTWQLIQKSLITYYGGWDNVPVMYKDYNANSTSTAETFGLEDGHTYTAYFMVKDKAGNISYHESAPFVYDTTAPVGGHTGLSNVAGDKFCEKIVVTAEDANLASVTANGVELTYDEEAQGYVIDKVGTYKLTATDKAGNSINAYFSVINHDIDSVTTFATCFQDGYIANTCLSCGTRFETTEELPCTGHISLKTVHTAATCTEDGFDTITCSACGLNEVNSIKTVVDENGAPVLNEDGTPKTELLYPKTGHDYGDWVVVKEATCTANGQKTKTCSLCGNVVTEVVTSDGTEHNWYPVKVVKATCETAGERSRTCRICGYKDVIDTLPAAGHTASGNYKVTKEPGCERGYTPEEGDAVPPAYGEKLQICSVCELTFGEAIAITELKAHVWTLTKTVDPTAEAKGHLYYDCDNCTATYDQEIDKLVQYTVKFYSDEGTLITSETKTAGETVGSAIADPTKANSADGKTKYEFAGWYTKKADGSYDKKYTLPMSATKDVDLYAKFNSSAIKYTVIFKADTEYDITKEEFGGEEEYKVLMGSIGDEREPGTSPVIKEDAVNTYVFKGWKPANSESAEPLDKIIITGDATYTAVFEAVPKKYDVIFMNGTVGMGKITVTAGEDATYPVDDEGNYVLGTPTKASDENYHYTFKGWDKALTNITAKTTVYAEFDFEAHDFDEGTKTQNADCLLPEMTTYKCKHVGCGYEKTEQTKGALGHDLGDATYDEETGENVQKCQRANCDYEKRTQASYTIKFNNENGLAVGILTVKANGEVKFDYEKYGEPTKSADAQYTYTFKGWKSADGTEYLKGAALPNATADATYVAIYTSVIRTFRVTYVDSANNVLYTKDGIAYGSNVPAYAGTTSTSALTTPKWDNEQHFVFDKWSVGTDTTVTADTVIKPTFKGVDHTVETTTGEANCTEPGGIVHTCTAGCGYKYIDGNVPALGHAYKVIDRVDPTVGTAGYIKYKCDRCGDEYTETIPAKQPITINVTVKDSDGDLVEGAKVALYLDNTQVATGTTNANGVATFTVYEDGAYYVIISGIPGYDGQIEGSVNVGEGSNDIETGDELGDFHVPDCTCSCHRTDFWGMFFRFFHKIIKLFSGKYTCCSCPDAAYEG